MIEMMNVTKKYNKGITAINNLSIQIKDGEFVYVVGPSGAGKSTFIKMMYREEKATKGRIRVGKYDLMKIKDRQIPFLRRYVGVVFQDFKLLQNESRKFEDGKVVLTQTSEVVFDVKVPNKNKLTVYADTHARLNEFHYGIGVEKQNGKFRYGAVYDLKDKEPEFYVRYDLLKVTTE